LTGAPFPVRRRKSSYSVCAPWEFGIDRAPIAVVNVYVERLISSIRRDCLGRMIVFGEAHLRRIVGMYAAYYSEARTDRFLNKDAPFHRVIERIGPITSQSVLGGLHYNYCRI
jgi:hypothetical protein